MSALLRLGQLWAALRATVTPAERALVQQLLASHEYPLFERMPLYDQRHCLDVYATLVAAGEQDAELLHLALYHDTGKVDRQGRPVSLIWYGIAVVWKQLAPRFYAWAAQQPRWWCRSIYRYAHHGPLGAELAAEAGCSATIVTTIRHYHDDAPTGLAARLRWADDQH